jgi:6-phosphogluconolactonase
VAPIDDSPKPPPKRITLTLPVLNKNTNHVIFCGTGDSKRPILQKVFQDGTGETKMMIGESSEGVAKYSVTMAEPPPYPCAMVRPIRSLTWIVDQDAIGGDEDDNTSKL